MASRLQLPSVVATNGCALFWGEPSSEEEASVSVPDLAPQVFPATGWDIATALTHAEMIALAFPL